MKIVVVTTLFCLLFSTVLAAKSNMCNSEDNLKGLLEKYRMAKANHATTRCTRLIVKGYFRDVDIESFNNNLEIVDGAFHKAPYKINKLLIDLQTVWNIDHLQDTKNASYKEFKNVRKSAILGFFTGGGISVVLKRWKAFRFAKAFRNLILPAAIVGGGAGWLTAKNSSLEEGIPIAPAQLSNYGAVYAESYKLKERKEIDKLTDLVGGALGAGAMVRMLKAAPKVYKGASRSLTFLKQCPYILAGSFLIGVCLDYIEEESVQILIESKLIRKYEEAKYQLEFLSEDTEELIRNTKALAQSTVDLMLYYLYPIIMILYDKQEEDLTEAEAKEILKEYSKIPKSRTPHVLLEEVANIIESKNNTYLRYYREAIVSSDIHIENAINAVESVVQEGR